MSPASAGPRPDGALRLATFNVRHAAGPDGQVDLDRYAAAVARLDADVLALQEAERHSARSRHGDLVGIAAEASGAQAWHLAPTLRGVLGTWVRAAIPGRGAPRLGPVPSYGIGLVSRYPVDGWRRYELPRPGGQGRLLGRGRQEPRAALATVVRTPDGPLTVVATHLTAHRSHAEAQLRALEHACRALPRPLVLLGDLNLPPAQVAAIVPWRPLATALTHPVRQPVRQIDHVLADGPVHAVPGSSGGSGAPGAVAVDTGLSDHRALVVDVSPRPT